MFHNFFPSGTMSMSANVQCPSLKYPLFYCLWFFCESPGVSRTLLKILADLKMCSVNGLNSSSDFQFLQFLFPIPWEPFQVHQLLLVLLAPSHSNFFVCFCFLAMCIVYFFFFFAFFYFYSVVSRNGKIHLMTSYFLLINSWSSLLAEIR